MSKGFFIAFEGGDGSGKTTQIKLLAKYLKDREVPVHLTKEPGGCDMADKIRNLLVKGDVNSLDDLSEFLLFSAARHEHVRTTIKPMLDNGHSIITDRFYLSSYTYQSFAGGLDFEFVENITKKAIMGCEPELTFVLDINPIHGIARARERQLFQDELRMESKKLAYHEKIREGFLKAADTSDNIIVIDAEQSVEEIHAEVIKHLENRKLI